jgi:DNA-binding transcriptional regulator YdaS (Cro superfamily)
VHHLSEEIKAFHASICARALLIAIDWAGTQSALAERVGSSRYAVSKWIQRGGIPPAAALILSHVKGFPLGVREMRPDIDWERFTRKVQCHRCGADINPPRYRTGYSLLLRASDTRPGKKLTRKAPRKP